ncbi:MAG: PDZ domain-containing protein [Magnetospirillum sp. WYHS-4]
MKMNALIAKAVLVLLVGAIAFAFLGDGVWRQRSPQSPAEMGAMQAAAPVAVPAAPNVASAVAQDMGAAGNVAAGGAEDPAVPNYIPRNVEIFEAHWQGMDCRLLTAELRKKLKFPMDLKGVLIGEVTLNAVDAGLFAGDVIVEIEDMPVETLEDLQRQSMGVRNQPQAKVVVLRKGPEKERGLYTMQRLSLVLRANPYLGMAQVEGAPQIKPGDPRPHGYRGACTKCHAIGKGFELTPDPDLITLPPPPISRDAVVKGVPPHEDNGPCKACHIIR